MLRKKTNCKTKMPQCTTKLSKKIDSVKRKATALFISASTVLQLSAVSVLADEGGGGKDAGGIVAGIAEIVVDIFPLIGIFFVIAGAFKLIMAYRNNQPEDQTSAAKDIVIGAVFIVFRLFVWTTLKPLII